jgi:hypothetical protein
MFPFHERLARLGLEATAEYGFVLAGGYAVSANGMGNRPSKDVDLFTNIPDPARFAEAVDRLRAVLAASGLVVDDNRIRPTFVDLRVTDPETRDTSDLQLGIDFRQYPPAQIGIGPVLDARDAVAGKMSALWSRGEARDFVDVDTVVASGCFTRNEILELADQCEAAPIHRGLLAERFREAGRHDASVYANYGVDEDHRQRLVASFSSWADEIQPRVTPSAPSRSRTAETLPRRVPAPLRRPGPRRDDGHRFGR